MATIIEGTQYALTSPIEKNHSVVFIKLTDSALKAIEDYALAISKGNASNSVKPLIELRPNNSQGIITIPNKSNENNSNKKDDNDSEKHCYNFSVKDIQNDGILECVKQTNSNMSMESLGKIMLRMQIHANDDVYQSTKAKMAVLAEQEMNKYNTKVIDVGRKTKSKRPFNSKFSVGAFNNHSNPNPNINNSNTSVSNSSSSSTFFNNKNSNMPRFSKFSNGNLPAPPPSSSSTSQQQSSKNVGYNNFQNNNEINKKIRHDLINGDGELLHDERVDINLSNAKQASRNLSVQQSTVTGLHDFPKYNNNPNHNGSCPISNGNSISPFSDTSVRSLSSPNSLNASPNNKSNSPFPKNNNNTNNIKRNPEFLHIGNNKKKFKSDNPRTSIQQSTKSQQPINNNNNNNNAISYSPLNRVNPLVLDHINSSSPDLRIPNKSNSAINHQVFYNEAFNNLVSHTSNHDHNNKFNEKESSSHQSSIITNNIQTQRNYCNGSGSMNSSPNSSPDSGGSSHVLSSDSSFVNDTDDYLTKYPKIQDMNQLLQYKNDFNQEFPEYKKLFDYVANIARQFNELKELINTKEEESEEWHELVKQIFDKYDEIKNKKNYQKAHKRLLYLHYKLLHIKNMINEYLMNNHT